MAVDWGNTRGLVVAVLLVCLSSVWGQDYCRLCRDHTMCLYQGEGPKCSPYIEGGVLRADQQIILKAINGFRQKVAQGREPRGSPGPQPPASNMRLTTWSAELATVAQRWADQCDFSMDKCRSVAGMRHVGQSIYRASATGDVATPDWPTVVNSWAQQVAQFNKSHVASFQWNVDSGLYSQLVWADTHLVGCGLAVHKQSEEDEWTHQLYVCNYGPGGNIMRRPVYLEGPACSRCPRGTSCSQAPHTGLCV